MSATAGSRYHPPMTCIVCGQPYEQASGMEGHYKPHRCPGQDIGSDFVLTGRTPEVTISIGSDPRAWAAGYRHAAERGHTYLSPQTALDTAAAFDLMAARVAWLESDPVHMAPDGALDLILASVANGDRANAVEIIRQIALNGPIPTGDGGRADV